LAQRHLPSAQQLPGHLQTPSTQQFPFRQTHLSFRLHVS
jgi:hypothetical protein